MMGACLGIIYWQQKEIVAQAKQSRADFRDMIRTVNRLMDDREEARHRGHTAYVDSDVAEQLDRREQRAREEGR
jgi:ABC-type phosphate transport system ATPase subunit